MLRQVHAGSGESVTREKVVVRKGREWSAEISRLLPWCFWDALSMSGWTPHGSMIEWASNLRWAQVAKQVIHVLEPLPIDPGDWLRPFCCYVSTVIFYSPGTWIKLAECECPPRMFPNISFVGRDAFFWEVVSGRVVHVFGAWHHEWRCYKNTELARHFNKVCDKDCRFCQLLDLKGAA